MALTGKRILVLLAGLIISWTTDLPCTTGFSSGAARPELSRAHRTVSFGHHSDAARLQTSNTSSRRQASLMRPLFLLHRRPMWATTSSDSTSSSAGTATSSSVPASSHAAAAATPALATDLVYDEDALARHTFRLDRQKPFFATVLWRFTRPHTLIGSAIAIPSLHALAAPSWATFLGTTNVLAMLYALVPALLMNLYITGLNQITDVDIDRVNKPNLVIPAGLLSVPTATVVVLAALAASLSWGWLVWPRYNTAGLQVALWGSGLLGTLYSLPPIRLKRFPLLAAFCIVAVRGTIINASFFAHAMSNMVGGHNLGVLDCLWHHPRCYRSSAYFGLFGIVIALMKDVPDVRGDADHDVRTLSVRLGPQQVFTGTRRLLQASLWGVGVTFVRYAVVAPPSYALAVSRLLTGTLAMAASASISRQAKYVDATVPSQVYQFYMYLWKIFYVSYLVLPFAR